MVWLNVKVSKATLDTHRHTHMCIHGVVIFEKLVGSYLKYMFNVRMHLKLLALPSHGTNESSK